MLIENPKIIKSVLISKKIGLPNFFGAIIFGWSQFGDDNEVSGIYRQIRIKGKMRIQRMDFFDNPITYTSAQIAQRDKFRNAVQAWQALSLNEKKEYNRLARNYGFYGYHLFIRRYMTS